MAGGVEQFGVDLEVRAALGLEGEREHLAGGQAAQLVEVERGDPGRGGVRVVDYPEHRRTPPAGSRRRLEIDYSGGYAASMSGMLIHNIWL